MSRDVDEADVRPQDHDVLNGRVRNPLHQIVAEQRRHNHAHEDAGCERGEKLSSPCYEETESVHVSHFPSLLKFRYRRRRNRSSNLVVSQPEIKREHSGRYRALYIKKVICQVHIKSQGRGRLRVPAPVELSSNDSTSDELVWLLADRLLAASGGD